MCEAAGGVEEFLSEHAVIAMADHSQAPITDTIALQDELDELGVLGPPALAPRPRPREQGPRIAVCPSQRAAMVYALHETERDAMRASVVTRALAIEGVEHVMWLARDAHDAPREGVISSPDPRRAALLPGAGRCEDARGARWSVEGSLAVIDATAHGRPPGAPAYPDALARVWSALTCPTSGEVLLSAAPGYEFIDWGRQAHVGGGSHGSLHASDSLGALVLCGVELARPRAARSGRSATSPRSCWATSARAPPVGRDASLPG